MKLFRTSVALLACTGLFVGSAYAVPVTCVSASGLPCVATEGDVLAGGVVVPNSGNDFENIVEAAIASATGSPVDLILYGKSDDNAALFNFSNFDQGSSLETSKAGNWSVLDGTLISYISVKAANSFVVFFIGGASSGTYSTEGILNNGGQRPETSHISFWTTPGDHTVPEPGTLLLLGAGLVGASRVRRRSKASC